MKAAVLEKPKAFYDKFERKGKTQQETTHYCPGCGHGNLHKIIAEALTDFGVDDQAIIVSPVGCSVFAYYYFGKRCVLRQPQSLHCTKNAVFAAAIRFA